LHLYFKFFSYAEFAGYVPGKIRLPGKLLFFRKIGLIQLSFDEKFALLNWVSGKPWAEFLQNTTQNSICRAPIRILTIGRWIVLLHSNSFADIIHRQLGFQVLVVHQHISGHKFLENLAIEHCFLQGTIDNKSVNVTLLLLAKPEQKLIKSWI
jgi:hypothetical protein